MNSNVVKMKQACSSTEISNISDADRSTEMTQPQALEHKERGKIVKQLRRERDLS